MVLVTRVRQLIAEKGYKTILKFAEDKKLSYYLLRKLANNETNSFDRKFIIDLCAALDCDIGDLLVLKKEKAS
ncbi:helix-turn-helix domain-containing protein [Peribacillus frigoritolerans]|uniref:helix-turn-helix domain-containing protein n=1 Tax=Peribacillus frigoritolerans TaxID=450367 RepID=UPI003CFC16E0